MLNPPPLDVARAVSGSIDRTGGIDLPTLLRILDRPDVDPAIRRTVEAWSKVAGPGVVSTWLMKAILRRRAFNLPALPRYVRPIAPDGTLLPLTRSTDGTATMIDDTDESIAFEAIAALVGAIFVVGKAAGLSADEIARSVAHEVGRAAPDSAPGIAIALEHGGFEGLEDRPRH